jgi:hypothetical protein
LSKLEAGSWRWQVCLALTLALLPAAVLAQSVGVRLDGEQLHIVAPQLHFLGMDVLQRLHNGIAVTYTFNIRTAADRYGKAANEMTYRFIVSYDIFEEKFAVNRIEPIPRSITHLTQEATEAWCLDSIVVPTANLGSDQSFWIMLDYRSEETKSSADNSVDSGASFIGQLIDVFSRPRQKQELHGSFTSGPFRLAELRKAR